MPVTRLLTSGLLWQELQSRIAAAKRVWEVVTANAVSPLGLAIGNTLGVAVDLGVPVAVVRNDRPPWQ